MVRDMKLLIADVLKYMMCFKGKGDSFADYENFANYIA